MTKLKQQHDNGSKIKSFEVMDSIYHKTRSKTNDHIDKVKQIISKQANQLYYHKKFDINTLLSEKKRQEDQDLEKYLKKSQITESYAFHQDQELKRLCKLYNIDIKFKKLPFNEKIRQIFNDLSAFYSYKKDAREMLDFSKSKNPDYIREQKQKFKEMIVMIKIDHLGGEQTLNEEEKQVYAKIKLRNQSEQQENDKKLSKLGLYLKNKKESIKTLKTIQNNQNLSIDKSIKNYHQDNRIDIFTEESSDEIDQSQKIFDIQDNLNEEPDIQQSIIVNQNQINIAASVNSPLLPQIKAQLQKRKVNRVLANNTFISDMKMGSGDLSMATLNESFQQSSRILKANNSNRFRRGNNYSIDLPKNLNQQSLHNVREYTNAKINNPIRTNQKLQNVSLNLSQISKRVSPLRNSQFPSYQQSPQEILKNLMYQSNFVQTRNSYFQSNPDSRRLKLSPLRQIKNQQQDQKQLSQRDEYGQTNQETQRSTPFKFNQSFKMKTPKLDDVEIQDIMKQMPKSKYGIDESHKRQQEKLKQKKIIQKIQRCVEKNELEIKSERHKLMCDQIVQNIKEDEFIKTLNTLKDIDYADSNTLQAIYEYRIRDEQEQLEQANEVVKEYHSGKLDPLNAMKLEKKQKKSMGKQH